MQIADFGLRIADCGFWNARMGIYIFFDFSLTCCSADKKFETLNLG